MSNNSGFSRLRAELDDAITYGSRKEALKIANIGLKDAIRSSLAGETEYFKGQIQLLKGNFAQAIEHFDAAVKLNPKDGASYNDRALCMVELGIIDEAFYYFDKGIAVEPDYATIYHNKGWLLNNIGRHKEAIECFKKALELDPDRPVTYDNLADALYNLADYKGALDSYKKVLELLKPGACKGIRKEISDKIRSIEKQLK
ncbi:MAG: tetratricopeptide repeat protein [Candidatus Omnitrophica bacterium]|nr:tetratricopeptide repeat protein [Candidatus Omnitrophota bacterium]MBU1869050.1 tetratricopeptide repeat protein [Candidatus Omnitrophota bacterium]